MRYHMKLISTFQPLATDRIDCLAWFGYVREFQSIVIVVFFFCFDQVGGVVLAEWCERDIIVRSHVDIKCYSDYHSRHRRLWSVSLSQLDPLLADLNCRLANTHTHSLKFDRN